MKILVACEESQVVTKAFRKLGHEAYSCDIQPCSGGFPEWHIQDDVKNVLNLKWDMLIAHPPCTYLSNAGARYLYQGHQLNNDRYLKGLEGKELFMLFYNSPINKICIENPLPSKIYNLPLHSQIIQPFEFGEPFSKRTLLWLKGLPGLMATDIIRFKNIQSTRKAAWFNSGGKERQKNRSKTFSGIAVAMAEQWSFH